MDMITANDSAANISDKIKEILFTKSAQRIDAVKPDVAATMFGDEVPEVSEEEPETEATGELETEEEPQEEEEVPNTVGAGTSFSEATLVRLVNTATGTDHVVTVQETAGGTTVGTFTILRGSVEVLEKQTTHTVSVNAGTAVLGAKVGYTN